MILFVIALASGMRFRGRRSKKECIFNFIVKYFWPKFYTFFSLKGGYAIPVAVPVPVPVYPGFGGGFGSGFGPGFGGAGFRPRFRPGFFG